MNSTHSQPPPRRALDLLAREADVAQDAVFQFAQFFPLAPAELQMHKYGEPPYEAFRWRGQMWRLAGALQVGCG